jgi:serine/threonine protein kinase
MNPASQDGPLNVGDLLLDKYEIRSLIGRGGHARVYHAVHAFTGRHVAIKCLHRPGGVDRQALRRGKAEAQILSQIRHPHIVDVLDAGITEQGTLYIVMELLRGRTLREVELSCGALHVHEVLDIAAQVASGLHASHVAGAIHRDLKPENVFISAGNTTKVLDFGVAKLADSAAWTTEKDMAHGTVHYMSPEQLRLTELTPRSDVYTLGVVMYEALLGRHPIAMLVASERANVWEISRAILMKKPPMLNEVAPRISLDVARLVNRAIAKVPEQRFGSMLEFERAILECRAACEPRKAKDGGSEPVRDLSLASSSPSEDGRARSAPRVDGGRDTEAVIRPVFFGAFSSAELPRGAGERLSADRPDEEATPHDSKALTRPYSPEHAKRLGVRDADTTPPTTGDARPPRTSASNPRARLVRLFVVASAAGALSVFGTAAFRAHTQSSPALASSSTKPTTTSSPRPPVASAEASQSAAFVTETLAPAPPANPASLVTPPDPRPSRAATVPKAQPPGRVSASPPVEVRDTGPFDRPMSIPPKAPAARTTDDPFLSPLVPPPDRSPSAPPAAKGSSNAR